jgi:hypothetical protein
MGYLMEQRMSITAGSGAEVVAIDTPALGDRSYLAHDGRPRLSSTRSGTSTGCWPWPGDAKGQLLGQEMHAE